MTFDYSPPCYTHTLNSGQCITLYGITMDGLSGLMQRHGELLELVFEGDINVSGIIARAPALAADMIATGAGEPEAADKVVRLPLGLQILLLTKVCELTFLEAHMGEVLGAVVRMFRDKKNPDSPTAPAI